MTAAVDPDDLDYDHAWRDCARAPRYLVHISGAVLLRRWDGALCAAHALTRSSAPHWYSGARTLDGSQRAWLRLSASTVWAASWGADTVLPSDPADAQEVLALFARPKRCPKRGPDKRKRKPRQQVAP